MRVFRELRDRVSSDDYDPRRTFQGTHRGQSRGTRGKDLPVVVVLFVLRCPRELSEVPYRTEFRGREPNNFLRDPKVSLTKMTLTGCQDY